MRCRNRRVRRPGGQSYRASVVGSRLGPIAMSAAVLVALCPMSVVAEDFGEWKQSQRAGFGDFVEQRDREFHQFLKAEWQAFQVFKGEVLDDTPKPSNIPRAPSEAPPEVRIPTTPEPPPLGEPAPGLPTIGNATDRKPDSTPSGGQSVQVSFLGHALQINVPAAWEELRLEGVNRQSVARVWESFARHPAEPVTKQLRAIGKRLALGDWGHLRLSHALGHSLGHDENTEVAITWALLLKSGLDVRVGISNGKLYLLYAAHEQLYDNAFFKLDGTRYYLYEEGDESLNRMKTYDADYTGADSRLAVAPTRAPRAGGDLEMRSLAFRFQGTPYEFEVPVQSALISHLDSIPQMDLPNYFRFTPTPEFAEALLKPLRSAVKGLPEQQQVNLLLRFAQTAFEYQTDQEQFDTENYLFPEETVYHQASDCEDRAALFAWLARRVLDRDVAALDYPGHVATALDLGETGGQGAHVRMNGRRLLVADPTYINADAGMVMPKYKNERAEVIPLW